GARRGRRGRAGDIRVPAQDLSAYRLPFARPSDEHIWSPSAASDERCSSLPSSITGRSATRPDAQPPQLLWLPASRSCSFAAATTYLANGPENTGYLGVPLLLVIVGSLIWLAVKRGLFALCWLPTTPVVWAFSLGTPIWLNGHRTRVPGLWSVFTNIKE